MCINMCHYSVKDQSLPLLHHSSLIPKTEWRLVSKSLKPSIDASKFISLYVFFFFSQIQKCAFPSFLFYVNIAISPVIEFVCDFCCNFALNLHIHSALN